MLARTHRPPPTLANGAHARPCPAWRPPRPALPGRLGALRLARGGRGPRPRDLRAPARAAAPASQRGRPRLPPARAAQHLPEPEAQREPSAENGPITRAARSRRRLARAPAASRARGGRALRGNRRTPGRFPRRPRRGRYRRPLVQGGRARPPHSRGHGDEPPLPRPPTDRATNGRRLSLIVVFADAAWQACGVKA